MDYAPIVLFVYKRLDHTFKTIEALQRCEGASESELIVFSDAAKRKEDEAEVEKVRDFLASVDSFAKLTLHKREHNHGLAKNIIDGVGSMVRQYKRVIVLEDDLICAPSFLMYMNGALEKYKNDKNIFSISGYNPTINKPSTYPYKVYLNYRSSSWGWATWLDRWKMVDWEVTDSQKFFSDAEAKKAFDQGGEDLSWMLWQQMNGRLDSWAIRFCYAHFKHNAFSLSPVQSLVENIGCDGSGVHSDATNKYAVTIDTSPTPPVLPDTLVLNESLIKEFRKHYKLPFKKKVKKKIMMDLLYG